MRLDRAALSVARFYPAKCRGDTRWWTSNAILAARSMTRRLGRRIRRTWDELVEQWPGAGTFAWIDGGTRLRGDARSGRQEFGCGDIRRDDFGLTSRAESVGIISPGRHGSHGFARVARVAGRAVFTLRFDVDLGGSVRPVNCGWIPATRLQSTGSAGMIVLTAYAKMPLPSFPRKRESTIPSSQNLAPHPAPWREGSLASISAPVGLRRLWPYNPHARIPHRCCAQPSAGGNCGLARTATGASKGALDDASACRVPVRTVHMQCKAVIRFADGATELDSRN